MWGNTMFVSVALVLCACMLPFAVAWLPTTPPSGGSVSDRRWSKRSCHPARVAANEHVRRVAICMAMEESAGGRADLEKMRRGFEKTLDGKLVMEYVQVGQGAFGGTEGIVMNSTSERKTCQNDQDTREN